MKTTQWPRGSIKRKLQCPLCGRMIGEHGYSKTGRLSRHNCPHGRPCRSDVNGRVLSCCTAVRRDVFDARAAAARLFAFDVQAESGATYLVLATSEVEATEIVIAEEDDRDGDGIACSGVVEIDEAEQRTRIVHNDDSDSPDESLWDIACRGGVPRILTCSEDY